MTLNRQQFEQLQLFDPGPRGLNFKGFPREPIQFQESIPMKMFMTPAEIRAEWEPLVGDTYVDESTDEFWERALEESKGKDRIGDFSPEAAAGEEESLHGSIAREGVKGPVHLGWDLGMPDQILGGHHRIAAAGDVAPDNVIPVLHHEGTSPKVAGMQTNMEDMPKNPPYKYDYDVD